MAIDRETAASTNEIVRQWRYIPPPVPQPVGWRKWGRPVYRVWIRFGSILGRINTVLLLSLTYILVLGPIAIAQWLMRKDHLRNRKSTDTSFWENADQEGQSPERSKHQF